MQVLLFAQSGFAVVQMYPAQIAVADDPVKVRHHLGVRFGRPDVETCSKEVTRVEADADAALVVDEGDDACQVFETSANDIASCVCLPVSVRFDMIARVIY